MKWLSSLFGHKPDKSSSKAIQSSMIPPVKENLSPYSQKRRYPRLLVKGMDIQSKIIRADPIQLSNISTSGACIITRMPLNSGNNVLISINCDKIQHPLPGTVIWESPGGVFSGEGTSLPLYRAGIQFKGVTPGTLVQLKDFMRIAGVPEEKPYVEPDKQSALRYVITREEGAILNYPTTYIVKKISLSGMLVEANCKLEAEQKYRMALLLPNENLTVKFNGRIVYQIQLPGKGPGFDTGIEFYDLTEHGKISLKRFIASLLWKHEA